MAVHANTTTRLSTLGITFIAIGETEASVIAASEDTRGNATASLQRAHDTLTNATALASTPEGNVQTQLTRALGLIETAENQATRVMFLSFYCDVYSCLKST